MLLSHFRAAEVHLEHRSNRVAVEVYACLPATLNHSPCCNDSNFSMALKHCE